MNRREPDDRDGGAEQRAAGVRRAAGSDLPAIHALIADAYSKYLSRMDQPPAPMLRDYQAAVRSGTAPARPGITVLPPGRFTIDHGDMHVEAINIGPSDRLEPVASVAAIAGKGLKGDRHFADAGARPGGALTLIEAEVLEDVGLTGAQSRRQVVVRGVRLNDLIGKRFMIGDVECLGVEICEPCRHLQSLTRAGIIKDLIHRGGLNADILTDGALSVGDAVSS